MFLFNHLFILSVILFLALGASVFAKKLNKPNLIFYILLGLIFSKMLLKNEAVESLVEALSSLGLAMLLFTIGLELPINKLFRAGKQMLVSSSAQIFLTAVILLIPAYFLLSSFFPALLVSLALSMSSTAVVAKLLQQKSEDTSLTGEVTLSILIFQDLVSVALIVLLTFLTEAKSGFGGFFGLFLQKVLAMAFISYVFSQVIKLVFAKIKLNREQLSLFIFGAIFLTISLFGFLNIPETTAGFIIGVLLASRVEQHEIFSQVRVFRDVLLVLFFFFLGTYLPSFSFSIFVIAFFLAVGLMLVKFFVLWLIFIVSGLHRKSAFWIGFDLVQSGEFGFILLTLMSQAKLISATHFQLLIMVIIWSLLLFSSFYSLKIKLFRRFDWFISRYAGFLLKFSGAFSQMKFDQINLKDHIVLCGYGRVGSYLGHGIALSNLPLIVIETDANRIKKLIAKGTPAIYGDATESQILDYAQVDRAKFLIITVPSAFEQEQIIFEAKRLNPKIQIFTRTHLIADLRHLKGLGVHQVIQPEFEAAITLLKKVLKFYDFNKEQIKKRTQYLKMEHGLES